MSVYKEQEYGYVPEPLQNLAKQRDDVNVYTYAAELPRKKKTNFGPQKKKKDDKNPGNNYKDLNQRYVYNLLKDSQGCVARHMYEIIGHQKIHTQRRLFMDIDGENFGFKEFDVAKSLIDTVKLQLNLSDIDCHIYTSTTEQKLSLHIIFWKTIFDSMDNMKYFVHSLIDTHENILGVSDIDNGVYTTHRAFRLPGCVKRSSAKDLNRYKRYMGTYTNGKFKESSDNGFVSFKIFQESHVGTTEKATVHQEFTPPPSRCSSVTKYRKRNFDCVDDLSNKVSPRFRDPVIKGINSYLQGVYGGCVCVKHVYEDVEKNRLFVITSGGNHFCATARRAHKSNNTYFMVGIFPDFGSIWQWCHDEDCVEQAFVGRVIWDTAKMQYHRDFIQRIKKIKISQ